MNDETTTKVVKNWSTKTVVNRFARKVAEVLDFDVFDSESPVRGMPVGQVLDELISADLKADYGSDAIELPGQTTVDEQIEGI